MPYNGMQYNGIIKSRYLPHAYDILEKLSENKGALAEISIDQEYLDRMEYELNSVCEIINMIFRIINIERDTQDIHWTSDCGNNHKKQARDKE